MSKKHLQLDPHPISDIAWWYEEDEGIFVVLESDIDGHPRALTATIPWRQLEKALQRRRQK